MTDPAAYGESVRGTAAHPYSFMVTKVPGTSLYRGLNVLVSPARGLADGCGSIVLPVALPLVFAIGSPGCMSCKEVFKPCRFTSALVPVSYLVV